MPEYASAGCEYLSGVLHLGEQSSWKDMRFCVASREEISGPVRCVLSVLQQMGFSASHPGRLPVA
jgi:hypothetical protein